MVSRGNNGVMKKSIALLAAFVITSTHQTFWGDWAYSVSDNQATITRYSGNGGEVVITAVMNEIPVVMIGSFGKTTSVTSVTIGNSVTSIGDWAFAWCTSPLSVTLPKLSVGDYKSFSLSANQIQFKRTPKNLLSESLLSFSENVSILLLADNIPSEPRFFPPLFNSVSLLPALLLSS